MEPEVLLDTDTVFAVLRMDPHIVERVQEYIKERNRLNISILTRFEILNSLKARGASARLRSFENFCAMHNVPDITDEIIVRASDIAADLSRRGDSIDDLDALIVATALVHGMALPPNDEERFSRIGGLQVENWLRR